MRVLFIFNPSSGHNRRRPWIAGEIRDFISSRSLDARMETTEGPGHATEIARDAVAAGFGIVVAVGGDGTMNEVAQALVHTSAALALVPCGSGNGLALHLGLPRGLGPALRLASGSDAQIALVDTGIANERPFFNAMGLGLDADVSRRFNRLARRGLPAYARVAWSALRELRAENVTVSCGNRSESLRVLLVAITNSDQYGNNARIAPGALVDDGELDLVAIKAVGFLGAGSLIPRLFLGTLDRSRHVVRLKGNRFVIDRSAGGLIHTDGETHSTSARVEVEIRPRSLRVVVPVSARFVCTTSFVASPQMALQSP
jgi:diacylglycerol kinase (ATP)